MLSGCVHVRLYKSLGEYDIVRGILSSRVSTHKNTSEAVDAEMRSDYNLAVKLYNEVSKIIPNPLGLVLISNSST